MRSTLLAQMALQAELLDSMAALERHVTAWDALAVVSGRPYCAPGWMLSWLRAAAPVDAVLRVCVMHDGDDLAGIAPFWTSGDRDGRYALLAERTSYPMEPLSAPGREAENAQAVAELLAAATPRPHALALTGLPSDSPWPRLVAERWSGGSPVSVSCNRTEPVPKVELGQASMAAWLGTRSRNFRQQLRHGRRRLEEAGAHFRISSAAELEEDVESLARLHHARWSARGGSTALDGRVKAMLKLAGSTLGPERFRLISIDVDGVSISAHLFLRAGATRSYWLGGFDDRWRACRPSIQVLAAAIEDGIESGDEWLELGPGGQHYKYRLADSEDAVAWVTLSPA
jgi:CelD/BcsL family acetyltransferase involved in cellulose biosynthesis